LTLILRISAAVAVFIIASGNFIHCDKFMRKSSCFSLNAVKFVISWGQYWVCAGPGYHYQHLCEQKENRISYQGSGRA
jgi:hypothetical protein